MPPGGNGFYYFSVYFRVLGDIAAGFDIVINGELVCTAFSDITEAPASDTEAMSCSGAIYAVEGICTHIAKNLRGQ